MTSAEALNIVRPLPLTVDDFFLLDQSGAFQGYGKTELIEGSVVYMNAQHRPHARVKFQLARELDHALRATQSRFVALTEVTVSMPPHNAPEPDIVLTSEPGGDGPVPLASVALIVEIADTTLSTDLGPKASVYARGSVPEYWVVDVTGRTIRQMWDPTDSGYTNTTDLAFGTVIICKTIDRLKVETDGLG